MTDARILPYPNVQVSTTRPSPPHSPSAAFSMTRNLPPKHLPPSTAPKKIEHRRPQFGRQHPSLARALWQSPSGKHRRSWCA